MSYCKCSFAVTLIKEDFACEKALIVTRRAGPDISCTSENASNQCQRLLSEFKKVGLPAFDAEDDLLKTPQSVFSKIQFGGLLGLATDITGPAGTERIENIYQLIEQTLQKYKSIENIPHEQYVETMTQYIIKRKRR